MTAENKDNGKAQFDPDFSPNHPTNRKAAEEHGLKYDPKKGQFVAKHGGNPVRDSFGQKY